MRLANLSKWLKGHTRLVRAMPNTPALIGEGVTGLFPFSRDVTREDRAQAETVLGAVGATVWITDESQMDAVTAISGSGPAYVFYFIEAVQEAAAELGLPIADRAATRARHLRRRGQARRDQPGPGGGAARARHLQGRHHRAGARAAWRRTRSRQRSSAPSAPPTSAAGSWARNSARSEGGPCSRQIAQLLIADAFGLFVYVLLLRFYMQMLRAPFRNPVGQFVTALTNWIVLPARRVDSRTVRARPGERHRRLDRCRR